MAATKDFWTDLVHRLTPYVPGEQRVGASVVKLNTNENPYPPTNHVLQAMHSVEGDGLRRYPDPEAVQLRESLADYNGVAADQVFVGNGSDEILALAFMAFFTGGKALQFPDISYSFYPVYCDLLDINQQQVALDKSFELDLSLFEDNSGGVVFSNPNAPTSIAISKGQIEALLKRVTDTVVLVDEAYIDFGAESVVELIHRYPNLLVSQTFSKGRSLAGMRIGCAFGDRHLIEGLQRVKNSFNSYPLDVVAQAAAVASIADEAGFRESVNSIVSSRDRTVEALQQRGYKVLPSSANFIFASPANNNAQGVFEFLNERDILVRYWNKPRLSEWLRITIGTDQEMDLLLSALDSYQPA